MAINEIVAKAGKQLGIKNPNSRLKYINPHIFKHSIARYLKNKGFSSEWIQNFLGNAAYNMTMDWYGRLSSDEIQQEAKNRLQE